MRYPASEKLEIIRTVEASHLPTRQTLKMIGIPSSTYYDWYARWVEGGIDALADRSPRPGSVWNRVPDDVREAFVEFALDHEDLTPREQTTTQCSGLPPTGARNHRPDGPKADHALTIKLDHSGGADQHDGDSMLAALPFVYSSIVLGFGLLLAAALWRGSRFSFGTAHMIAPVFVSNRAAIASI